MGFYKVSYEMEAGPSQFNQFPVGMREIEAHEFWNLMRNVPSRIEFRQPFIPACEEFPFGCYWGDLFLYYRTDVEGVAYSLEWGDNMQFWVRYFWFGPCRHILKEISQKECIERGIAHFGMCWHVVECTKCGRIHSYDSSG